MKVEAQNAVLWAKLAAMYAYTGDRVSAVTWMRKALTLDSTNPYVLLNCADAYEDLDEHRTAVEMANQAVANGLRLAAFEIDPVARRFRAHPDFKPPTR